jgi:hypothetical protein
MILVQCNTNGGIQKCGNIWQRNLAQREYLGDKNKNGIIVFKWIFGWWLKLRSYDRLLL